eukprot:4367142-Prymnesium_polylepis.1
MQHARCKHTRRRERPRTVIAGGPRDLMKTWVESARMVGDASSVSITINHTSRAVKMSHAQRAHARHLVRKSCAHTARVPHTHAPVADM